MEKPPIGIHRFEKMFRIQVHEHECGNFSMEFYLGCIDYMVICSKRTNAHYNRLNEIYGSYYAHSFTFALWFAILSCISHWIRDG